MTNKTIDQSQLATQLQARSAAPAVKGKTVFDLMKDMTPAMVEALPQHMSPERLLRIATTTIRTNPKLNICTAQSLLGAIMQCAQLGLEPGILGHAYLVPYRNRKKDENGRDAGWADEAQFQIGYKGLIELARRTGQVVSLMANSVHENDEFNFEYGMNETLKHVPALGDRGKVTKYYAYARLKDGAFNFMVMSREDIERHRDKFSKAKSYGPWVDHFDEMAKKTVLKALCKYMPISVEFQKAVAMDDTTKRISSVKDITPDLSEIVDVTNWQVQEDTDVKELTEVTE